MYFNLWLENTGTGTCKIYTNFINFFIPVLVTSLLANAFFRLLIITKFSGSYLVNKVQIPVPILSDSQH